MDTNCFKKGNGGFDAERQRKRRGSEEECPSPRPSPLVPREERENHVAKNALENLWWFARFEALRLVPVALTAERRPRKPRSRALSGAGGIRTLLRTEVRAPIRVV